MQSRMFHHPVRMKSPNLFAMENTVTAAMWALVSSPNATTGSSADAVGLSSVVNLQRETTRSSNTSSSGYISIPI
jgi:hypothetical protein